MKIYRPTQTDFLFQKFGENLACAETDAQGQVKRPFKIIPGTFPGACPVSTTKFYPTIGLKGHNGWDSGLYYSEPVYFPVVSPETEWKVMNEVDSSGGIGVDVYSTTPVKFSEIPVHTPGSNREIEQQYIRFGGLFLTFRFWHLLASKKENGSTIKTGEVLGLGDTTGASSGNHLHWSLKAHDGNNTSLDLDNGFTGAFDHKPYYENKFVVEALKTSFSFTKTLRKGMVNVDVGVLQAHLVRWGYMKPFKEDEVGIYGGKTATAVLAFQEATIPLSWYEKNVLRGTICGPKTLEALNRLIA